MGAREIFNHHDMKKKMKLQQWAKTIGGLALTAALSGHAWAAGVINSITSGEQAGEIVVRVQLSEPLTQEPSGFVMQDPARIAIDLPGVRNGMGRSLVDLSQGNLRSIVVAEASDRARLIFNLGHVAQYQTEVDGNVLLVRLSSAPVGTAPRATGGVIASTVESATNRTATVAPGTRDLRNIDFRPSADGAGALILTLPSDQTSVDVRQQGDRVIIEILQASLPAALRKKLDVSDYQTPMQTITPEQSGQNVRLTVHATGYWDQSAYQAQNQFVLELHPVADDARKLIPGSGYKGELLSLSFQDVDVHVLLKSIASFTGLNVITSDSVRGSLTLHLNDVPWDQALDIIMQARGLAADRNGNVLWIAPREEIDRIQQQRLQSYHDNEQLAPLRTQVFQLNYAKSDAIVEAINSTDSGTSGVRSTSLLSERGSIIVDPRTNKLIVTDTPTKLENLASVIAQIDIPVRQVMIEARIVEANDGWGRNLGTRLSGNLWGSGRSNHLYGVGGTMPQEDDDDDDDNNGLRNDPFNFFNLQAAPTSGTAGFFGFQFARNATQYLQLELQALETENYGRNIASPSLTTQDSVKAYVEQGVEIPYLEASSSGATSISFKKAVLGLEVTPTITPDGTVQLDILVSQDTPDEYMLGGVSIKTNRVNTRVTVENGGTIVIGGIFKEQEYTRTQKIPFLGDIPLIGTFFRSSNRLHERTELLVFITPRIIDDGFVRTGGAIPNFGR